MRSHPSFVGSGMQGGLASTLGRVVAAAALVAIATTVGCAPPVTIEGRRAVQSRYLAPDPVLTAKASAKTRAELGIDEWRIFRGRGALFVTGYRKNKAVSGLTTMFTRDAAGDIDGVGMRVNDGSRSAAVHSLARNLTVPVKEMNAGSQAFVRRASLDLARLRIAANLTRRRAQGAIGMGDLCAETMSGAIFNFNACMSLAGANATKQRACVDAASLADTSRMVCIGTAAQGGLASVGSRPVDELDAGICGLDERCITAMQGLDREESLGTAGGFAPMFSPHEAGSAFDLGRQDELLRSQGGLGVPLIQRTSPTAGSGAAVVGGEGSVILDDRAGSAGTVVVDGQSSPLRAGEADIFVGDSVSPGVSKPTVRCPFCNDGDRRPDVSAIDREDAAIGRAMRENEIGSNLDREQAETGQAIRENQISSSIDREQAETGQAIRENEISASIDREQAETGQAMRDLSSNPDTGSVSFSDGVPDLGGVSEDNGGAFTTGGGVDDGSFQE